MILVCGEALIDIFSRPSGAVASLGFDGFPGGSPLNLAVGLARLGRDVAFLGAISTDFFGRALRRHLEAERVSLAHAKSSVRPTPLSFVSIGDDGSLAYAFRNEGAADHDLLPADLPAVLAAEIDCLTIGSYTLGLDPAGEALVEFVASQAGGRVVSFDPNVRLDLVADPEAWRRRFDRLIDVSTIVKISVEDVEAAFGAGADADRLAQSWLERGVALVAVTAGPDPVRLYGRFGRIEMAGPRIETVDTVGAGDSFHAALLAHLDAEGLMTRAGVQSLDGSSAEKAAAFACRAAAITCTRRGADLPHAADLEGVGINRAMSIVRPLAGPRC